MTKQPSNVSEERIIINCRDAWPEDPEACTCPEQNTKYIGGQDGAIGSEEDFTSDQAKCCLSSH